VVKIGKIDHNKQTVRKLVQVIDKQKFCEQLTRLSTTAGRKRLLITFATKNALVAQNLWAVEKDTYHNTGVHCSQHSCAGKLYGRSDNL
jgi:hypothetical protein